MAAAKPRVIAIEEHYFDPEVKEHIAAADLTGGPAIAARLEDVGQGRIAKMDAAGIDMQVLSHGAPSVQKIAEPELAVRLARSANDRLADTVRANPDRFAGFAMLPTAAPAAAADELERAVTRLGFKGAMLHGLSNGVFLDDRRFWPIFERAEALDVPIYLHPAIPHPAVIDAYYKEYVGKYPNLLRAAWGFTVETATQGVRMVLSNVFETYPGLKIILGHFGEGLPFLLWRINMALVRDGAGPSWFRDTFCEHFWVTTSGFFSDPALLHAIQEIGIDRVLFSVDYPFVENAPGTEWAMRIPLSAADREKILGGNATRLLKLS
ncbi:MAG: amidohydrolase family protein [Alphaproteobacteria bacterium]